MYLKVWSIGQGTGNNVRSTPSLNFPSLAYENEIFISLFATKSVELFVFPLTTSLKVCILKRQSIDYPGGKKIVSAEVKTS